MTAPPPAVLVIAPPDHDVDPSGTRCSAPGLERAIAQGACCGRALHLPPGTYRLSRGLDLRGPVALGGAPGGFTVLRPDAGVAVTLAMRNDGNNDGAPRPTVLRALYLDGRNTRGATGLQLGHDVAEIPPDGTGLSGRLIVEDVQVMHYRAGGVAVDLRNVVDLRATGLYAGRSGVGLRAGGRGVPRVLPTVCVFTKSSFREHEGAGVSVDGAWALTFRDCLFEANRGPGLVAAPAHRATDGARVVPQLRLDNPWFEDNWRGATDRATRHHLVVDGSAYGGEAFVAMTLTGGFFSGDHRAMRLVQVLHASLAGFYVERLHAPQVTIEGDRSAGVIHDWPFWAARIEEHVAFANGADASRWALPRERRPGRAPLATRGDEDTALTLRDHAIQHFTAPLSAARRVTLPADAVNGDGFRITRAASATGAAPLRVADLRALAPGEWCDVAHDGRRWVLVASGRL